MISNRKKFDLLNECSGFTFTRTLTDDGFHFEGYIIFPDGSKSDYCTSYNQDIFVDELFLALKYKMFRVCHDIEEQYRLTNSR